MKKIYLSTLSLILLVACNNNAQVLKKDDVHDKRDVVQSTGFYKDFIYVEGKKVSVDVNKLNDNKYVLFYRGKEVTVDNEQLLDLKNPKNENKLFKSKELSDYEIISYKKHGDHWHIKTTEGEFISYKDPSKLSKQQLSKITKSVNDNSKIVKSYKHGDHWHVVLEDGREIISYTDPNKSSINIPKRDNNSSSNVYVVNTYKHGDHWHIVYSDGHEEISYIDPSGMAINDSDLNTKYFLIRNQLPKYYSNQKLNLNVFTNDSSIVSYKWFLDNVEIGSGIVLDYDLSFNDNAKKIVVKGYDSSNRLIKESTPFVLNVVESFIGVIDGVLDHYHTDDLLKLSVNFDNSSVVKYRWLLKKENSLDFIELAVTSKNYFHSSFKLNDSYHRSVIKVEGLDINNQVVTTSTVSKIFINDHKHSPITSGDVELGKKSLMDAGIDERLIYSLMVGQSELPFPGKELNSAEIEEYLNSVHAINLRKSNNPLSLNGIERLKNLESLDISYTEGVSNDDINKLLQFKKLRNLNLSYTGITDLSFLKEYKNLIGVSLMGMGITNLDFLKHLSRLEKLNLSYNTIDDFSPISNLVHLTHIGLDNNNVKNLDFLSNLDNLVQVSVDDNPLSDLSPLRGKNLKSLYVSYTKVNDFKSLGIMPSLLALYAISDDIESLEQFIGFSNLEVLDVSSNKLSDFRGLDKLPVLETLNVNNNKLLTSLKLDVINNSVHTLKMNRSGLSSLEYKSMWKKLTSFSYSNTPALSSELGSIENVGSNTANIVYYDGINYALLHNDHTHIYNNPLKLNTTKIVYSADTDKIVGFSETGYYVNRFLKNLSDGSAFYNLYHIDGNIDFAFELPTAMNDNYQIKQEYVDRIIEHRISIVEKKLSSASNHDELKERWLTIKNMRNDNDKLIAINGLESEIVINNQDNVWESKGNKINNFYLSIKDSIPFFEQFQYELQYEVFLKALGNNNVELMNKTYQEMVKILSPYGYKE